MQNTKMAERNLAMAPVELCFVNTVSRIGRGCVDANVLGKGTAGKGLVEGKNLLLKVAAERLEKARACHCLEAGSCRC
jgi:hypothetical protein